MSISITRYVDIASSVGGAAVVATRSLMGRLFTDNTKVPVNAIVTVDSADDVAAYFGSTSEEYKRAVFYFAYVSKTLGRPKQLSFARWAKVAAAAKIYGAKVTASVADFAAIVAGGMTMSVGGQAGVIAALDLHTAVSYADVATLLQTALHALAGSQYAAATVVFDATSGGFIFTGSTQGAADISITVPGNLAGPLGWASPLTVFSPGVAATAIGDALAANANVSDNFGGFAFVPTLTIDDMEAASAWNATKNVSFMYSPRVAVADAAAWAAAVAGNEGTGLTLAPLATEYPEILPIAIVAATQYDQPNSVQSFEFQRANLTASVTDDTSADVYDNLRVNYYGQTQTAGQNISFYQRGVLMGVDTAPVDMNTYANEMWLKAAETAAIMSLLLAVGRVPANPKGRASLLAAIQAPVDQALLNGVISVGKPLTVDQKVFIGEITNDPKAWYQVQNAGYWLDVVIVSVATPTPGFKAVYTLVYSKDDVVRKVEGFHVLV